MLDLPGVRNGTLVFRFLLGAWAPTPRWTRLLKVESRKHDDVLVVNAIDGHGPNKQCSCTEKTVEWIRYAYQRWPRAKFYGKTEGER